MPTNQELLRWKFPPNRIKQRPGPGGKQFSYIEWTDALDQVMAATGNEFHWVVISIQYVPNPTGKTPFCWLCHGRLTLPGLGSRDGIGTANPDNEDSAKSAESDAFKRACVHFGVALELYTDLPLTVPTTTVDSNPPVAKKALAKPATSPDDAPVVLTTEGEKAAAAILSGSSGGYSEYDGSPETAANRPIKPPHDRAQPSNPETRDNTRTAQNRPIEEGARVSKVNQFWRLAGKVGIDVKVLTEEEKKDFLTLMLDGEKPDTDADKRWLRIARPLATYYAAWVGLYKPNDGKVVSVEYTTTLYKEVFPDDHLPFVLTAVVGAQWEAMARMIVKKSATRTKEEVAV